MTIKAKEKGGMKGFEYLIISVLVLVVVSVGIRFFIAWNQDWSSIFHEMTATDWFISIALVGVLEFLRRKLK